ncbi:MAG: anion permease [Clostridiales Family XIII bacterium]|nr:anion permease [Clostridiales Family XIII bacterium]
MFLVFIMPTPGGMSFAAQEVLGITAWTIIWWVCEPIPIPASGLIPFILLPFMGIMPPDAVFAYLGHSNNFLMIGIFIFVGVMIQHGFAKRIALWLLSRKTATRSASSLMSVFLVAMGIISAFMSNIPATMLFLMIAAGMCEAMGIEEGHPYSKALKFSSAFGAQAGGLATPIGAPNTNFLSMGLMLSLIGYNIRFADWVMVGLPFAAIILVVTLIYFRKIFKVTEIDMTAARQYSIKAYEELGPLNRGEKISIFLVILAIILWLIPSFVAAFFGNNAEITTLFDTLLNASVVSVFVAILAFLIPIDWKARKFATNWTQAERSVNWGVIVIVTTGFLLGGAMNAEGVRLIGWMAGRLSGVFDGAPQILIVLGFVLLATFITQFISNVPAISIVTTVSVPVAMASGLNPVALAFSIAMAAQMSYALPIAAPQMAIAYGSGGIRITEFVRVGVVQCLLSIPFTTLFVYYWSNFLFPYAPV